MELRIIRHPFSWSLLIHVALVVMLLTFEQWRPAPIMMPQPLIVEVPPLPKDNKNQIVTNDTGKKADEAADQAFLGKDTRVVDEQKTSKTPMPLMSGSKAARAKTESQSKPLSKFGVALLPKASDQQAPADRPEWSNYSQDQAANAQEYVKGLKEGETTALNTKEYIFYGYFDRIRKSLDLAWPRMLREQLEKYYRHGRALASEMDHITRTLVTLNEKGEIVRVQVLQESGTQDLDEAAVKAFNKAGPFPNPPRGLLDPRKEVQIRWDFILRT